MCTERLRDRTEKAKVGPKKIGPKETGPQKDRTVLSPTRDRSGTTNVQV